MRDRIVKLLQLTQSDNDFEALLAIRKANALLKDKNQDWNSFLAFRGSPERVVYSQMANGNWVIRVFPI